MPIEGFDYKGFAQAMAEQAKELVPKDIDERNKEYVVNTLGNFTMLAGEALYNDDSLNLTPEQAVFITQIIAEWSFHKSIDLIHSGILPQYWDSIMQKIAFTIFEVAKQAVIRNIPQDQLLQAVEHHVNKVYKASIEELQEKGVIDEEIKNKAESQSNIDAMAQQVQQAQQEELQKKQQQVAQQEEQIKQLEQQQKEREEAQKRREEKRNQRKQASQSSGTSIPQGITQKQMKLMTLAMVLKVLNQDKVTTILNKFDPKDSTAINNYMKLVDLESHLDGDLVTDCIKEIREFLPVKQKLSEENVLRSLLKIYQENPREKIEKIIKNERPLVKRFIAQSYEGEFSNVPLRVAGIIAQYIEESV